MADVHDIWTRREEETARAYACFCVYRDLNSRRSLAEAYRQETGREEAKQAPGTWAGWYAKFDWKKRAEAYDAHLEERRRAEREAEYIQDLEAFRKRQKKQAQETSEAASLLLKKAQDRLKTIAIGDIPPDKLPAYFRAAAAISEAASNTEATALGVLELMAILDAQDSDRNA